MKVYMVRYGQTDWNVEERRQGSIDTELNTVGVKQTEELRTKLQEIPFTACYTSPLQRASATAHILVGDRVEIISSDLLRGRGFGELEGKLSYEVQPDQDIYDIRLNADVNGIEPIQNVVERTRDFLQLLRETYQTDDKILVVTHGLIMRVTEHLLAGDLTDTDLGSYRLDNDALLEFELN